MHLPDTSPEFRVAPRWLLATLLAVFAIIFVQFLLKTRPDEPGTRSAFMRWRPQLQELDDGVNIWDKYAYPNPPMMALLLKPFMALPPTVGSSLWFACKVLFALAAMVGVWSLLDGPDRRFPLWAKSFAVLWTLRPIEGDLVHGNVNLLILVLIVGTLVAFHRRRDGLAGLLLGLSIACKLTPALFLVYFLWKRAWTTLGAAGAGLIAFGLLIPALAFGWSNNLDYLHGWQRQMIVPYAAGVVSSEHKNQSLPGLLHRLLCDEASFSDYVGEQKITLQTHNVLSLDRDTVQAITVVCMIAFAAAALYFCRPGSTDRPGLPLLAEFSVIILGMLLFCERTWKHHCVTLLLPFCASAYCLASPMFSRAMKWQLGVTFILAGVLMLTTSSGVFDHDLDAHDRFGKFAQVYGAYVWTFLLLLAGMFFILRKTSPASRAA